MLDTFRTASKSWVAKVLFGLLILSFGAWGVGDVVRMSFNRGAAIEVGSIDIGVEVVAREFQNELRRLQARFGSQLTSEQAKQFGLLDQTIERVVSGSLLDAEAKDLGLVATDEAVRRRIASYPAFQNQFGQFDPYVYSQALNSAGLSEDQFVRLERENVLRALLSNVVAAGTSSPDALVDAQVRFRQEKRVAETLTFEAAKMPAPALPDDKALADYHQAQADRFMAPEYRKFTALVLTPADAARDVQITDVQLEEAYAQRADEFSEPERRHVEQVLFDDQATAAKAVEGAKGKDLAVIAKEAGTSVTDLGVVDKGGLPPEVSEAVFALAPKTVGQPVQSPLGWHVFRVTAVEGGQKKSLAEVKDKLRQDLITEKGLDRIYEISNQVQDLLAGGANLGEVATKLNLKTLTAEVDADGKDRAGQPVKGLPQGQALLQSVFTTGAGADSDVGELENQGGFFVVHVDDIAPAALRPFDSVKKEVAEAWIQDQKAKAAQDAANAAAEKLKAGASLADAAAGRARIDTTQPFTREQPGVVPASTVQPLFAGPVGTVAVGASKGAAVVTRLKAIQPVDPKQVEGAAKVVRNQTSEQIGNDLIEAYVRGLRDMHGVSIDRDQIEQRLK